MSDLIPIEALEKLNKADLQKQYELEIGTAPEDSLTKAQLIEAIESNREMEGTGNPPPPPPPAPEKPSAPAKPGKPKEFRVIKKDEKGAIIDESVLSETVWNNLPPGKHGWQIEPPAELKKK